MFSVIMLTAKKLYAITDTERNNPFGVHMLRKSFP